MTQLRCLVVDDEPLACESLRALLDTMSEALFVGQAHRVKDAVSAVRATRPDVLFLDVQMPGGGGFEVLRRLTAPPVVVFVTAHDQFALRAFEVNAVDYLLKPVDPRRLQAALDRAGDRSRKVIAPDSVERKPLTLEDTALLQIGASGQFVPVADMLAIRARDKYTEVLCAGGDSMLVRQTMREWQRRLPAPPFMPLGRALLVNVNRMASVKFADRGASITLGAGHETIELGRAGADRLRKWLKQARVK